MKKWFKVGDSLTKFIIIDNSIQNNAGHHYQYAAHCLKAANELGYSPVLATNKAYSPSKDEAWNVIPVYSYGFWIGRSNKFATRLLVDTNRSISTKISKLKCRAVFSRVGLSWEMRKNLVNYTNMPGEAVVKHPFVWIALSSIAVFPALISIRMARYVKSLKRKIISLSSGKNIDPITSVPLDKSISKEFTNNTRKLFKKVKLEEKDIIFIPTVGINELLGLLEYFNNAPDAKNVTWHLLFRRNIFSVREFEYWRQDESLRILRNVLINFIQSLSVQNVYLYTDTKELSGQYERVGKTTFHTLPIPHTIPPRSKQIDEKSPLTVTYIGDARTEKGYHYMPHIIDDLWSRYIENGKIRFTLQSNFNIPNGEPKVAVARSQLEFFPKDKVTLIYDPLSFDEYIKLLLSSDIVLLPYEESNYYARSSGILVECLCAGIPVIVPTATWLSRQFINEIYHHHEVLLKNMRVIKSLSDDGIVWLRHNSDVHPYVDGELVFGGESNKAYCWLLIPPYTGFIHISFIIRGPPLSSIRVDLAQLRLDSTQTKFTSALVEKVDMERSSVLMPIESDCHRIWLGFKNAFGKNVMYISRINITFLQSFQLSQQYPIGAVGLTYENPAEISDLLSNMVDNYTHYRDTALSFAQKYSKLHNARSLINEIKKVINVNQNPIKLNGTDG